MSLQYCNDIYTTYSIEGLVTENTCGDQELMTKLRTIEFGATIVRVLGSIIQRALMTTTTKYSDYLPTSAFKLE